MRDMTNGFLSGKGAVVTGGSRGIGRAIVLALAREGASVVFCGRDQQGVQKAVADLRQQAGSQQIYGIAADVRDPSQVEALFRFADEQLGRIDVLVNNAGVGIFRPTGDLSIEDWRAVIETNLTGAFLCSREAIARFRRQGGGSIIHISSLAGKHGMAGGAAYNASKFGLNGMAEAMMLDHRYDNIRVSTILPGSVATEFGGQRTGEQAWKIAPEDIAEIVLTILRMPERTLISAVEVRPAKPHRPS